MQELQRVEEGLVGVIEDPSLDPVKAGNRLIDRRDRDRDAEQDIGDRRLEDPPMGRW